MTQAERYTSQRTDQRQYRKRTSEILKEVPQKSPYEDFIDFLSFSMPSNSFKTGVEYGRMLINGISFAESHGNNQEQTKLPDPATVSQEILNGFIRRIQTGRDVDVMDGPRFVEKIVKYHSKNYSDVMEYILKEPNVYFRMGAALSLNLSEYAKDAQEKEAITHPPRAA